MIQFRNYQIQSNILATIGNTPLVQLERLFPQLPIEIFGKLEAFNPGGSIKDRTAFSIISSALRTGQIKKGDCIIESSSGNMAIGLAQICKFFGLKLIVVVDPKVNPQNINIIRAYGGQIDLVTEPDSNGGYLQIRLRRVKELVAQTPNSFWSNQYANPANPLAHQQTMHEIFTAVDGNLDYLFIATSTCGTITGCADYLKQYNYDTKVIAVDALGSVIFGTKAGKRMLPGHGASRPSELLKIDTAHQFVQVSDAECVWGCRRLLEREVIMAGASSGGIVTAVAKIGNQLPKGARCVLLFADRGERYLDTVYNDEWLLQHFCDNQIKLIDI